MIHVNIRWIALVVFCCNIWSKAKCRQTLRVIHIEGLQIRGCFIVYLFNRPGLAGAVLQTALFFIHLVSESVYSSILSKYHKSQIVRARELTILRECSPPTKCHMSHVSIHVSHVTCHVSHVTCHVHMSYVLCHMSQCSGEAQQWRVYPVYFYLSMSLALKCN